MGAMPKTFKLPIAEYTSPGVLSYYVEHVVDIVQYPDAKTELFKLFREFGNSTSRRSSFVKPYCEENEKPEDKHKRLEAQFTNLKNFADVEKLGTAK
uniref:Uncharacterized protein n=1 Tax=Megaselia scalaris TaxID=36166 RepID=T1GC73_MEGSC